MKRLRNQAGQMTVEAILIMIILLSVSLAVSRYMRSEKLVAKIVEGPWLPIRGMIENGVWAKGNAAKAGHPSQPQRHSSNSGDEPPTT